MIKLSRIFLYHWHRFDWHMLDVQDSLYLAGHNGSGKSSILDALQLVLVADLGRVRFNSAAQDRSQRSLDSYVRGKIGEQHWLRPGDTIGYVVLEWTDDLKHQAFVSGVCLEARAATQSVEKTFFIFDGQLNPDVFIEQGKPRTRREIKAIARNRSTAESFDQTGEYQAALLNRLGGLNQRFFDLFLRALTFQPIRNIREFVEQWLLEPNSLDVHTLQNVVERLRDLERKAKDVEEQLKSLGAIIKTQEEAKRLRGLHGKFEILAAHYAVAAIQQQINQQQQRLIDTRRDYELNQTDLEQQLGLQQNAQVAWDEARFQLSQSDVVRRKNQLAAEIQQLQQQIQKINQRWRQVQAKLTQIAELLNILQPIAEQDLVNLLHQPEHIPQAQQIVPLLQQQSTAAGAALKLQLQAMTRTDDKISRLFEQESRLKQEITQLEQSNRQNHYPQNVENVRKYLKSSLNIELFLLCELLEIPDEHWQNAVEAMLGQRRFNIIVEPKYYSQALDLLDQLREKERIFDVGLVDLQQASAEARPARPLSLATKVKAKTGLIDKYIAAILGDIITCQHVQDLRQHRRAITAEVMVYQEWTARSIDPRKFQPWFIGERAQRSQIESRRQQLTEIQAELAILRPEQQRQRQYYDQLEKLQQLLLGLDSYFEEELDSSELQTTLLELQREHDSIDTSGVAALEAEVKRLQIIYEQYTLNIRRLERIIGTLNNQITQIEQHIQQDQHQLLNAQSLFEHTQQRYPEQIDDALNDFQRENNEQSQFSRLQETAEQQGRGYNTRFNNTQEQLREQVILYNRDFRARELADIEQTSFQEKRAELESTNLPDFAQKIAEAKHETETELREHVLHKLRENIGRAKDELDRINDALQGLDFNGQRYHFRYEIADSLRDFYQLIEQSANVTSEMIQDSEFYQQHKATFDRFFQLLIQPGLTDQEKLEQAQITDYRRYLSYDIDVIERDGTRSRLSKIMGQTSGGETQTPFYVTIAASFVQLYKINERSKRSTIRIVAFDEAFSKMDQDRIGSTLDLFHHFGLQIITATPIERCEYLVPKMCTTLVLTGLKDRQQRVLVEPYRNYAARLEALNAESEQN
ncbi:MAG: hypothetical protein LCH85_23570 [Chloroflexi bacterium]|nr:hypothetical protein [Chloroflexota bacterium]